MTIDISNNSPRISYSVAAGVTQTSFAVPFEFFADIDLNVYVDEVLQTITTNYTVSGGDGSTGTITMTVTGAKTVIITRDTTIERTTDFTAGVDINRAALNTQLDTLTAIGADVKDLAERAIRIKDFDPSTASLELPAASVRADKLLSFDTEGNVQTQAASDLLTGSVLGANYTKASHTGDGTIVAFSTTEAAGSKNNIQVYIDGVYQNKDTFSISGSTLTFTEAPPLNSAIEFIVGNAVTSLTTDPAVVTYNQGGTGAQDRTLTSKLQDTVSVKDFGAVGDGTTDDSAAIQAALDAAANLGVDDKGALVHFPSGKYKITSTINYPMGKFVSITGDGKPSMIIWDGAASGTMFLMDNFTGDEKKIFIENIQLKADAADTVIGFEINRTSGQAVVNVSFRHILFNTMGVALQASNECDQIVFENNYILSYQTHGIKLLNGVCNNWFIQNNHFRSGIANSVALSSEGSVNIVFTNNTVQSGAAIRVVDLTDCDRVELNNIYAEATGTHATKYTAFKFTDSSFVNFENIGTTGAFGDTGVPLVDMNNVDSVIIKNVRHDDSGGTPPEFFDFDTNCSDVRFINAPSSTSAGTTKVNEPLRVTFGPYDSGYGEIVRTNQFVGWDFNQVNISGSSVHTILYDTDVEGIFMVSATQATENNRSFAIVWHDGTDYQIHTIHDTDNTEFKIQVSAGNVQLNNLITSTRTCTWAIMPLSHPTLQ